MPIRITNKQIPVHQDYFEFCSRWRLEAAEYEKAKLTPIDEKPESRFNSNPRDKQTVLRRAGDLGDAQTHWPRMVLTEEINYNQFLDKITGSNNNKFHPARDEDRRPLPKTGAMHAITDIIRLKTEEDKEFLLSKGEIVGYDAAGEQVIYHLPWPERWFKTLFNWQTEYNNNSKSFVKRCLGPIGLEVQYLLEFNKENAKKLFDSRASDQVNFVVKQENSDEVRMVEKDVNSQKTFERFLQPFDYLWNAEYIPAPVKAELRQQAVARGFIKGGAGDFQPPSSSTRGKNTYQ